MRPGGHRQYYQNYPGHLLMDNVPKNLGPNGPLHHKQTNRHVDDSVPKRPQQPLHIYEMRPPVTIFAVT